MNLTHNNQKQILPYSGTTMSLIAKNSQVSGFYYPNLNNYILKYNEKIEGSLSLGAKKDKTNLNSQTSFEHLTKYNNNLNSQFNKFNKKNQII